MLTRTRYTTRLLRVLLLQRGIGGEIYNFKISFYKINIYVTGRVSYGFGGNGLRTRTGSRVKRVIHSNVIYHLSFTLCTSTTRTTKGGGAIRVTWGDIRVGVITLGTFKVGPVGVGHKSYFSSTILRYFICKGVTIIRLRVFTCRTSFGNLRKITGYIGRFLPTQGVQLTTFGPGLFGNGHIGPFFIGRRKGNMGGVTIIIFGGTFFFRVTRGHSFISCVVNGQILHTTRSGVEIGAGHGRFFGTILDKL